MFLLSKLCCSTQKIHLQYIVLRKYEICPLLTGTKFFLYKAGCFIRQGHVNVLLEYIDL